MIETICHLCGHKEFAFFCEGIDRVHFIEGTFRLYRCKKCSLLFIYPQPDDVTLARYYPETYYAYNNSDLPIGDSGGESKLGYYLKHPLKAANAFLYSKLLNHSRDVRISEGDHVLDVGCGAGRWLIEKKKLGAICYGVDISREGLSRLKKTEPAITTYCGHLWEAGFPDAHFDVISLCHVLEHVRQTGQLLEEIKRILKKDGILRVQVPNSQSLTRVIFGKYWMGLEVPRHIYVFSKNNLSAYFDKMGFTIAEKRTIENSYGILSSSVHLFNALTGKKKDLSRLQGFWDNEFIKIILFPYAVLVYLLRVGDTVEFEVKKK